MKKQSGQDTAFLNRFQLVWARKRRVQLGQVAVSSLLLAVIGLGIIAIADYWLELDRSARVVALGAMLAAVALFAINSLWRTVRRWSQPTTAAEIENAFPELGQSVRTTVQFGTMQVDQVQSEGVASTLVTALAEQTHQRSLPLTIEDVVPSRKLGWIAGGLAAGVALLAGASSVDWQWRNATQRAVLNEQPYRQLEVRPGDQAIDEGTGLNIHVALIGRTNREVTLFTRPAAQEDAEWTERKLEEQGSEESKKQTSTADDTSSRPQRAFVVKLNQEASVVSALEDDGENSKAGSQKSEVGDQKSEPEKPESQKPEQQ